MAVRSSGGLASSWRAGVALASLSSAAPAQVLLSKLAIQRPPGVTQAPAFGSQCVRLADVDGDGVGDLLISAEGYQAFVGDPSMGAAFVISANTQQILRTHRGTSSNNSYGSDVDAGHDVDGDGTDDYVIGDMNATAAGGPAGAGALFVHSGATGSLLHVFTGAQLQENLGNCVALIPDVDGDGHAEIVGGAPLWDLSSSVLNAGRACCWSGATGALLWTHDGTASQQLLATVAELGDVDGDGIADVGLGSVGDANRGTGKVEIVRGSDGTLIRTLVGAGSKEYFGYVRECGDVDADGIDDCVVVAPGANRSLSGGRVTVHSGATGGEIRRWDGEKEGSFAYGARHVRHDFDGDGWDDVVIAQPFVARPDCGNGVVRLMSGRTGRLLFEYRARNDLPLDPNFGSNGDVIDDVNGDAIAELLISSPWDANRLADDGRAYVFAGDDLFLQADQNDYDLNDPITVELRGGTPGVLGLVALVEVDGAPLWQTLVVAPLDANGELAIHDTTDAAYLGHSARVRGWCLPRAGRGPLIDSNEEWFQF